MREKSDELERSQTTFQPKILEKSKSILHQKRDSNVPIHARLYYQDLSKKDANLTRFQGDEDKENTFTPNIQEKSKHIVRNQKVEDVLYNDAKRRNQQKK